MLRLILHENYYNYKRNARIIVAHSIYTHKAQRTITTPTSETTLEK